MYNNLRFTENVEMVMQYAGSVALQYGSMIIDTEHILYGLSRIKDSVASRVLSSYGITSENLESLFYKLFRGSSTIIANEVDLSSDSKEALSIANQFAIQIGHNFIGTEHLLIALLMGDDYDACNIIKRSYRVNINDMRNSLLQVLKSQNIGAFHNENSGYESYVEVSVDWRFPPAIVNGGEVGATYESDD